MIKKLLNAIKRRRSKEVFTDEVTRLREVAQIGETLQELVLSRSWMVFSFEVLDELEVSAFEVFKGTDPTAWEEIVQAQMMAKMIDQIRRRIQALISEGELAVIQLRDLSDSTLEKEDVNG